MPAADPVHEPYMRRALEQAEKARAAGEVPIGAALVRAGSVIGEGFNRPIASCDPTAHAEIVALRAAGTAVANYRLPGTTLYVTVEPCLMCVGAAIGARVETVVYGVAEPKWGAVESILAVGALAANHRFGVVSGILADECRALMVDFFKTRRG